jgi:hypothetical protein
MWQINWQLAYQVTLHSARTHRDDLTLLDETFTTLNVASHPTG